MIVLDLHTHSRHSHDSLTRAKDIVRLAKKRGLTGVAVTDHNTIAGALEAQESNDDTVFEVIIGSEVATDAGDVIGLFLSREIQSRSAESVIEEIHDQGGLAVLPHPFRTRPSSEDTARRVDAIEVFNSREGVASNARARELALRLSKPAVCGSDAHFGFEVGSCRVLVEGDDSRAGIASGKTRVIPAGSMSIAEPVSGLIGSARLRRYSRSALIFGYSLARIIRNKDKT